MSRAHYRVNAIRSLTGGRRMRPKRSSQVEVARLRRRCDDEPDEVNVETEAMYVMENGKEVNIKVRRLKPRGVLEVEYETVGVTATAGEDFIAVSGTLRFEDGELVKALSVEILDDDEAEEDETFYLRIWNPRPAAKIGRFDRCMVTIVDDDEPGQIGIDPRSRDMTVHDRDESADVIVRRYNGSAGDIHVSYETNADGGAVAGVDFTQTEGQICFGPGEMVKMIRVPILSTMEYGKDKAFHLTLLKADGVRGAKDFYNEQHLARIRIVQDEQTKQVLEDLTKLVQHDLKKYEIGTSSYVEQFRRALFEIGDADEEGGGATMTDLVLHGVSLPFKLLFATIPPTDYGNAWPCFFVSLAYIGALTAVIGDLASIFGCLAGLEDGFTAITFVALGTSLPDTFASKAAAESDETADASVGNVTGSNSVNVFLGLGLPWSIAAIYWAVTGVNAEWRKQYGEEGNERKGVGVAVAETARKTVRTHSESASSPFAGLVKNMIDEYPEGGFVVIADSLGFSVGIFCICAILCIGTLVARRAFLGYELGGPAGPQLATGALFVALWLFYIVMSWLQIYGHI
eukprot:scaffold7031_cov254-Pinguiococcus_pyrenoidosus.AAC.3